MRKKIFFLLTAIVAITTLTSFSEKKPVQPLRTIIIDAGHGGHDVGARGQYSNEKDICLAIETKLAEQIRKQFPGVQVIRTRSNDEFVHLHKRADIANHNKGELFLSIHVNAAPPVQHRELTGYKTQVSYTGKGKNRKKVTRKLPQYRYYTTPNPAKGTETYIWGAHKNEDKEVALRENAPMLIEDNYKDNYGDIDPNSPEFIALSLLKTKQFFKRSAVLAGMVEDQFVKVGRVSRGQKQRQVGIWVLQATAMPSVLVETGYITNRTEEDYLNSEVGQNEIAQCVSGALKTYIDWLNKNGSAAPQSFNSSLKAADTHSFLNMIEGEEKRKMSR